MSGLALKFPTPNTHVENGQRTLRNEAEALSRLADSLGEEFDRAIESLASIKGRVITCGMGKSGHIAHKMAATFASTGTPSFFVHPSEASHGDLGMITKEDGLIVLSNSGETSEISDILHFAKRFSIPLISMTSHAQSTLARFSSIALVLPPHEEACPLGLAPTTSSTMMLALGDALAVALLQKKDFAHHDFKRLHPGGRLGQQLLTVADLMRPLDSLPIAFPQTLMSDAIMIMSERGFGYVTVTDESHRLLGIVTDGDLRRHMDPHLLTHTVEDIMTRAPLHVAPTILAAEALAIMNEKFVTNLCVTDPETRTLRGVIQMHDCLKAGVA